MILTTRSVALVLGALAATGCTLPAFVPPADRDPTSWGTVPDDLAEDLAALLDIQVDDRQMAGLQLYVRTPTGERWFGASGSVREDRVDPLTREHCMRIGSATKMQVAAVVHQLVDEGAMRLDAELSTSFDWLEQGDAITVDDLLTHAAGLPEVLGDAFYLMEASAFVDKRYVPAEVFRDVASREATHAPRAERRYSNTHYVGLGLLVEEATGQSLDEVLDERIYTPLGLNRTAYVPWQPAPPCLVPGFDHDLIPVPLGKLVEPEHTSWATLAAGSGAGAASAEDLGRMVEAIVLGPAAGEPDLLSTEARARLLSFERWSDESDHRTEVGRGVFKLELAGRSMVGHEGQFIGSEAIGAADLDDGTVVAVVGNRSAFAVHEVAALALSLLDE